MTQLGHFKELFWTSVLKKLWVGRDACSRTEMKSCSHENLRKQLKILGSMKANLRRHVKIVAEQLVYYLCMRTGQKQQV